MKYFQVPSDHIAAATVALISSCWRHQLFRAETHWAGSRSWLALPTVVVVVVIILMSLPHLTVAYLEPITQKFCQKLVVICRRHFSR